MAKLDLTLDGRLDVHPFVTEAKYNHMADLLAQGKSGGFTAEEARVKIKRALAESDAVFSLAHLMNVKNLPDYDVAERNWTKIANIETVDDFNPTTFQNLRFNFDNLKYGKGTPDVGGISPRVSEGDTYVYAYGYTEEAVKAAIEKRGFKFGVTLEDIINDPSRTIRRLPGDMLQIALDTDEYLVFTALQTASATVDLNSGVYLPTGAVIPANAPFSAPAVRVGLSQIAQRTTSDGRKIPLASGYWVVVATGQGEMAEAEIERERSAIRIQDGVVTYGAPSQGNFSRIRGVIESEWITDSDSWYLAPEAGTTKRASLVKLQLAGRTAPEVLVNNFTGTPISRGTSASPFDLAHFDNDTVDLKLRQFTNSALITEDQLVWSNGSSS